MATVSIAITESWGWTEAGAGVSPLAFDVTVTEAWGWSEASAESKILPINITPNSAWSTFIAYQATFVGDGPGSQPLPVIPPPVMGVSSLPASGPIGTISIPTVGRIWEIIPTAPLNFDWHESKSARLENGQIPAPTRMYWCGMGQTSYQLVAHKVPIADAIQIEAMLNGAQSAVTFYTADHLTITGDPTTVQRTTDSNNVTCELTVEVFPPEG